MDRVERAWTHETTLLSRMDLSSTVQLLVSLLLGFVTQNSTGAAASGLWVRPLRIIGEDHWATSLAKSAPMGA